MKTVSAFLFVLLASFAVAATPIVDVRLTGPNNNLQSGSTFTFNSGSSVNFTGSTVTGLGFGTGSVTSVAATVPSFLSVAGSPITTSGTLAFTLATQTANLVFAGPSSGSAAAPTFRGLVAADMPTTAVTAGNYGDATHVGTFTVDAAGRLTAASNIAISSGGTGTVTSVDMTVPSGFSVGGNPVTSAGTLAITYTAGQTANRFLATPDGSTGSLNLRGFVAGDLPTSGVTAATYGDATHVPQIAIDSKGRITSATSVTITGGGGSGVTSVDQSVPAGFAISGNPITSTGTLAISYATGQTANRFLATPDGTTGALSERAIVSGDFPTSGVTASTYGDSTHVGAFTVDSKGRITSASSVSITGGSGITGSTGSTDRALVMANGTGGSTVQAATIVVDGGNTAINFPGVAGIASAGSNSNVNITPTGSGGGAGQLQVSSATPGTRSRSHIANYGDDYDTGNLTTRRSSADNQGPGLGMQKSRGSIGSPGAVVSADGMGYFRWSGYNGSAWVEDGALIGVNATETWSGSGNGTYMRFHVTPTGTTSTSDIFDITETGVTLLVGTVHMPKTITAGGTTGAQTINKAAGSVNFATAATSLTVTDSLVDANSIIICTVATNDTALKSVQAVPTSGSFTLFANAAAAGETRVQFVIIN